MNLARINVPPSGLRTSDSLAASMRQVQGAARELNVQVGEHTGALADTEGGTAWIRGWAAFYGELTVFLRENEGFWSRLWGSTADMLDDFIRRYNGWESSYNQRARVAGIPQLVAPSPEERPGFPAWGWLALGVVGIIGVAWLVRETRQTAMLFRDEDGRFLPSGDEYERDYPPEMMPRGRRIMVSRVR